MWFKPLKKIPNSFGETEFLNYFLSWKCTRFEHFRARIEPDLVHFHDKKYFKNSVSPKLFGIFLSGLNHIELTHQILYFFEKFWPSGHTIFLLAFSICFKFKVFFWGFWAEKRVLFYTDLKLRRGDSQECKIYPHNHCNWHKIT